MLASVELSFAGEQPNLSSIQRYGEAAERSVRHDAERVYWDWFAAHGDVLDRIFDDLVRVRTGIARTLGAEDFVAVGYQRLCRVDYDRDDVERLRAAVRDHVVPLAAELRARQAVVLGVKHLRAWDERVHDKDRGGRRVFRIVAAAAVTVVAERLPQVDPNEAPSLAGGDRNAVAM